MCYTLFGRRNRATGFFAIRLAIANIMKGAIRTDKEDIVKYNAVPSEESSEATTLTGCEVYRGIELVYRDIHSSSVQIKQGDSDSILEISHCREGRMEYELDGKLFSIMPGDIAIFHRRGGEYTASFPIRHYHGISIIFDLNRVPKCLSCFLEDVNVSPHALAKKFCADRPCFIARSNQGIEHIFSELYNVPTELKKGYFKVKVLELTLFLTAFDTTADETEKHCYSPSQALLAKEVRQYLTEHMTERVTLEQLSEQLHVSGTHIKNTFKKVCGESVYSYIRVQKMQAAALLLKTTNDTVLEIAGRFGYDNASKFTCAFRDVMGVTPTEYRLNKS